MADQSAFLQAACTKSKCIELLALAADYREALPQVLELLRQYYAAEKVCFYECGEPDTDGRQEAGSFSVPVIFEENLYGKLQVEHSGVLDSDRELFSVLACVLASEIRKKKLQEYLLRLSYQDQLTGIRNNTSYIRMLNQLLEHPVPVGVAFADLNGLKYLNDTYGHEYGDQALRHLAEVSMEYFAKDQLYRDSTRRVQECPGYAQALYKRYRQREEKEE